MQREIVGGREKHFDRLPESDDNQEVWCLGYSPKRWCGGKERLPYD
jgi:hypothetical protein